MAWWKTHIICKRPPEHPFSCKTASPLPFLMRIQVNIGTYVTSTSKQLSVLVLRQQLRIYQLTLRKFNISMKNFG